MNPRYLIKTPKRQRSIRLIMNLLVIAVILILVYVADLLLPSELSTFPLYLIPITLATSIIGNRAGYLACLLSCIAWLSAYLLQGNSNGLMIPIQAMLSRGLVYFLITYMLIKIRDSSRIVSDQLERLKTVLPICPACGKLLCYDGKWRNVGDVLHEGFFIEMPTHNCQHISEIPTEVRS